MQNKTLIIAGMHRSGTSLITHWLSECGLQLGENFLPAGVGNVDGHYEDIEFLKLHEEILNDNHLPPTGLTDEHNIDVSLYHREKLKSVIRVKNALYPQWGWKDPRTCLFLDTYKELLPDARYLIVVRDYQSVVSSLLQRDFVFIEKKYLARGYFDRLVWNVLRRKRRLKKLYNQKAEDYLKIWIAYNEEILKNIKTLPESAYVMINYSLLNTKDDHICSFLKTHWHLSLKYSRFKDIYKDKLISKPINTDAFILNKSLLSKANQLQTNLNTYMAFS
ncbi:sulfotransferase [Mucilaginibacter sp. L196]|uniref:sulfotransferase n=1 Tax=Mucilaginibacter sp. L196 TaxID=1641870 RepID=UPI00131CBF04|nr:sulfotransferase [Mucilaginibacter sp. L196]